MVYRVTTPLPATEGGLDWGTSGLNNQWPYNDNNFYIDFGSTNRYGFGPTTASLSGYIIVSIYSDVNDWSFYVDGGTGGSTGGTSPLYHSATNTVGWRAGTI